MLVVTGSTAAGGLEDEAAAGGLEDEDPEADCRTEAEVVCLIEILSFKSAFKSNSLVCSDDCSQCSGTQEPFWKLLSLLSLRISRRLVSRFYVSQPAFLVLPLIVFLRTSTVRSLFPARPDSEPRKA